MKTTQNLPARLKELRKKNKYSQEYVAEQLNISRQAISHWENGKSYPDIDNLVLLADVFHISVDELLNEKIECEPEVEVPCEVEVPEEADVPHEEEMTEEKDIPDEVEVVDKGEESSAITEKLVLCTILLISSNLPIVSIPIALVILTWSVYKKRHYKLVYFLCVLCIVMGVHEMIAVYTHFNGLYGNLFIVPR